MLYKIKPNILCLNKIYLIKGKFNIYKILNLLYLFTYKKIFKFLKIQLKIILIQKKKLYNFFFWKFNYIILKYSFNRIKSFIKINNWNKKFNYYSKNNQILYKKFSLNKYFFKNNLNFLWPNFLKLNKKKKLLIYNIFTNKYNILKKKTQNVFLAKRKTLINKNLYKISNLIKKNYNININKNQKTKFKKQDIKPFKKIYKLFVFWFLFINNNIINLIINIYFFNWYKNFYMNINNRKYYNYFFYKLYLKFENFINRDKIHFTYNKLLINKNYIDISNKNNFYKINSIYKNYFLLNRIYSNKLKFNKLFIK